MPGAPSPGDERLAAAILRADAALRLSPIRGAADASPTPPPLLPSAQLPMATPSPLHADALIVWREAEVPARAGSTAQSSLGLSATVLRGDHTLHSHAGQQLDTASATTGSSPRSGGSWGEVAEVARAKDATVAAHAAAAASAAASVSAALAARRLQLRPTLVRPLPRLSPSSEGGGRAGAAGSVSCDVADGSDSAVPLLRVPRGEMVALLSSCGRAVQPTAASDAQARLDMPEIPGPHAASLTEGVDVPVSLFLELRVASAEARHASWRQRPPSSLPRRDSAASSYRTPTLAVMGSDTIVAAPQSATSAFSPSSPRAGEAGQGDLAHLQRSTWRRRGSDDDTARSRLSPRARSSSPAIASRAADLRSRPEWVRPTPAAVLAATLRAKASGAASAMDTAVSRPTPPPPFQPPLLRKSLTRRLAGRLPSLTAQAAPIVTVTEATPPQDDARALESSHAMVKLRARGWRAAAWSPPAHLRAGRSGLVAPPLSPLHATARPKVPLHIVPQHPISWD